PAMITRWPLSGSIRISGMSTRAARRWLPRGRVTARSQGSHLIQLLLHRDVLDPRFTEYRAARTVAEPVIQWPSVGLSVQDDSGHARRPALGLSRLEQPGGHPPPPVGATDGQTAELHGSPHHHQPAGTQQPT